jgi:hypothetical protein
MERWGGFDLSFRIAADYDAVRRYFGRGLSRPAHVPRVLVKLRVGGESNCSIGNMLRKSEGITSRYAAMKLVGSRRRLETISVRSDSSSNRWLISVCVILAFAATRTLAKLSREDAEMKRFRFEDAGMTWFFKEAESLAQPGLCEHFHGTKTVRRSSPRNGTDKSTRHAPRKSICLVTWPLNQTIPNGSHHE